MTKLSLIKVLAQAPPPQLDYRLRDFCRDFSEESGEQAANDLLRRIHESSLGSCTGTIRRITAPEFVHNLPFAQDRYEVEDIYVVSQTTRDGRWNKLCKSQEQWWYSHREAKEWLDKQEDWFRAANRIFKLRINVESVELQPKNDTPRLPDV